MEEELHSDEVIGPAFTHFLQLLVERVPNRSCGKSTDSKGSQCLRTTYKDYELEFHMSTMRPCTPGDTQQLLRKSHIGKDIVTVVFQEPGAMPFTPKNIRLQLQQVFIIVRVHSTGIDSVSYSLAVSRSKDVPAFGPPIPKGAIFPQSAVFRDFC
ncbi:hypothetical protein GJAV_G00241470 [Gymnothorax javanicus]|nr:hypothetical protein GJAV_G00241470 [Gymnothorax javanicus]